MSTAQAINDTPAPITQNIPVPIPFGKLKRSKKNMRTIDPKNSQEDKEMVASIRSEGIIQNLCAYAVGDHYEVPAGGRRLGALEYLFKHGEITADFPVYCIVIREENATHTSVVENYHRKAPHPADVFTAFTTLLSQGYTVASIAASNGITELQVERNLQLGKVHKTLFKLFQKSQLTLDQMMAFASTSDTKLQLSTFKAMGQDCNVPASKIRTQLQSSRYSSDTALAKLVTIEAYQEAGGAVEPDLFTESVMLLNVELLVALAEEKLLAEAARLKGWKWVETSMEGVYSLHEYQRLPSTQLPTPKHHAGKLISLTDEMEKLDAVDEDNWTDEIQHRYSILDDDISDLQDIIDRECTSVADEDKLFGGCIVTFCQNTGDIEVHKGLLKHDDVKAFQSKDNTDSEDADASSDSTSKEQNTPNEKPEMSARLMGDLGIYKRSIIKAELSKSTALSVDLLHFQVCVSVLGSGRSKWMRFLDVSFSSVNDESSIGDYKNTEAAKALGTKLASLDTGWLSLKDEAKQFSAFRKLSANKRQTLVSYCVAQQLLSGGQRKGKDKLVDLIVDEMRIDFSQYWRPTAENFFSRLSRPLLLTLGKKLRGAAWSNSHATASTKKAMVDSMHQFFHSKPDDMTEKEQELVAKWLPVEINK